MEPQPLHGGVRWLGSITKVDNSTCAGCSSKPADTLARSAAATTLRAVSAAKTGGRAPLALPTAPASPLAADGGPRQAAAEDRDRLRPLDLAGRAQPRQQQPMQPLPGARPLPLLQPPPAGRARAEAELERQVPPGNPGVQDKEDPAKRLPVGKPLPAG